MQTRYQSAKLLVLFPLIHISLAAFSWSRLDLTGGLVVPWTQQALRSALPVSGHTVTELSPSPRHPWLMECETLLGGSGLISAALSQPPKEGAQHLPKEDSVSFFSVPMCQESWQMGGEGWALQKLMKAQFGPLRLGSHKSCSVIENKWQLCSNGFQAVKSLLHFQELLAGSEGGYTRTHLLISYDIMQCTHQVASSLKHCSVHVFALH